MEGKRAIGFEIKTIMNMIKRKVSALGTNEEEDQLTRMHMWITGYLYDQREKGDVFQRDIEAHFTIRRSTATGILQLMEKNGLLVREPVSYDARLKKLVLTPKAISKHETFIRDIDEFEASLRRGLTEEEIDSFFMILDKLKKNLE